MVELTVGLAGVLLLVTADLVAGEPVVGELAAAEGSSVALDGAGVDAAAELPETGTEMVIPAEAHCDARSL